LGKKHQTQFTRNFFSPNNRALHGGLADAQPACRLHTTHPEQFVYILPFRLMLSKMTPCPQNS